MHDHSLITESLERKERVFLPTFQLKSGFLGQKRKKKSFNSIDSKTRPIITPEAIQVLLSKADSRRDFVVPQINKNPVKFPLKIKTFRFQKLVPPSRLTPQPLKPLYYMPKLFEKKQYDYQLTEPYKFLLTGANFNYLNRRIMENNSSSHSIQDPASLDAKYKHTSPEPRGINPIHSKTSTNFSGTDTRRVIYKITNMNHK